MASAEWAWNMGYVDPAGGARVIAAGFRGELMTADGSKVILLHLPTVGTDRLTLLSMCRLVVDNSASRAAVTIRWGLGTWGSIAGGKPLYPYLGVNHNRADVDPLEREIIAAGECRNLFGYRCDIVDERLESAEPIPGWPNWQVHNGSQGVPPAIAIWFAGDAVHPVTVRAIQALAVVV